MPDAYCYVMVNGGIDTAGAYPYEAEYWVYSPRVSALN